MVRLGEVEIIKDDRRFSNLSSELFQVGLFLCLLYQAQGSKKSLKYKQIFSSNSCEEIN